MSTTTNFFEALNNHKPVKRQEIFFRLYYDEDGNVITYSMKELEGNFIEVTCAEFAEANKNVYVKDGQIHKKVLTSFGKLIPIDGGSKDITVITNELKWKMKTYE